MRLINAETLELAEFIGNRTPPYVILSHTWGDEEVSFKDMQGSQRKKLRGFAKIENCCAQALRDGYEYAWIDTCCIDKSSSAELSEAINSMYNWYEMAEICYAYLEDIAMTYSEQDLRYPDLGSSKWFTRGWTLQELIAPRNLEFYDVNWVDIGTKQDRKNELSRVTGIDLVVLEGGKPFKCNVAQRMSWAAKRITTRGEDIAYCLMGLFNVNMPLIYGEGGHKAFRRLQEEILKAEEDYTLFAWSGNMPAGFDFGLLAESPRCFEALFEFPLGWQHADLRTGSPAKFSSEISTSQQTLQTDPPHITSRGLRICLPLGKNTETGRWACLLCPREQNEELLWPCVILGQLEDGNHIYHRIKADKLEFLTTKEVQTFTFQTITVKFAPSYTSQWASVFATARFTLPSLTSHCIVRTFPDPGLELSIRNVYPFPLVEIRGFQKLLPFSDSHPKFVLILQGANLEVFFINIAISKDGSSCEIFLPNEQQDEQTTVTDLMNRTGKSSRDMMRLPSGNLVVAISKYYFEHHLYTRHSLYVYLRSRERHDGSNPT